MIERIVSGGQTGADQGGLAAGMFLDIHTGGWAANGWLTDTGPERELLEGYGLKECPKVGYPARTEMNVQNSDGTVIITREAKLTGGSYQTMCLCESIDRPLAIVRLGANNKAKVLDGWVGDKYTVHYPSGSVISFRQWHQLHSIRTLNVAGPRESKCPGIQEQAFNWLVEELENQ